ncbi:hypothetical protein [Fischerella sp. PCC 9605]|uniref:hypothetical protein n=1 Tax=Fischerella sp. PCC 9605 TaxID=1173024 RepID=UPI00047D721E|nr:hypothetical protein [Fischerella sp. PCC 9605]
MLALPYNWEIANAKSFHCRFKSARAPQHPTTKPAAAGSDPKGAIAHSDRSIRFTSRLKKPLETVVVV